MISALRTIVILSLLLVSASAQSASNPIRRLLDIPAPLPESAYDRAEPKDRKAKWSPPKDDAPFTELIKYWQNPSHYSAAIERPSRKVLHRFLDAAESEPDLLPRMILFDLIPDEPSAHERVKALLDQRPRVSERKEDEAEREWQKGVRDWLMLHSRYLTDELVERAVNVQESNGYIHSERYSDALARLDPERARPVLETYLASGNMRRIALALSLMYRQAISAGNSAEENSLREKLLKIAVDVQAPDYARAKAIDILLKTEWAGRDDWYLSLFKDRSLIALNVNQGLKTSSK